MIKIIKIKIYLIKAQQWKHKWCLNKLNNRHAEEKMQIAIEMFYKKFDNQHWKRVSLEGARTESKQTKHLEIIPKRKSYWTF